MESDFVMNELYGIDSQSNDNGIDTVFRFLQKQRFDHYKYCKGQSPMNTKRRFNHE